MAFRFFAQILWDIFFYVFGQKTAEQMEWKVSQRICCDFWAEFSTHADMILQALYQVFYIREQFLCCFDSPPKNPLS